MAGRVRQAAALRPENPGLLFRLRSQGAGAGGGTGRRRHPVRRERHLDGLAQRIAAVRDAATSAGRDPAAIDIWVVSYASVRPTRAQAIDDLKAFIVVNGMAIRTPDALAQVPTQFHGKIAQLHARYDPTEHVVVGGRNVALMEELGLTDFLSEFDTLAGPVEAATDMLRQLAALGVSTFIAALPGHAAPLEAMRGLAQARSMM